MGAGGEASPPGSPRVTSARKRDGGGKGSAGKAGGWGVGEWGKGGG